MAGPEDSPAGKRKPASAATPVSPVREGGTGLAEADALEIAYSHLRSALDAYAHDLYPVSLARTFEQKGKTEALAGKLVEDEKKWMGLLKTVDEHIELFKSHKLEHKQQLEKARLVNETIPHYEPPSEEELFQILPREYVDFMKQAVPTPRGTAPAGATEPAELSAVPEEPDPAGESGAGPAADDAPLRFDNIKFESSAPAAPAAPAPRAAARTPPPPPSPTPRKPSPLVFAGACGVCVLAGAVAGFVAGGRARPAVPARAAAPTPAATSVELLVDGSGYSGEKYESPGKVTVTYAKDLRTVTIYVNSVAEAKPAPKPEPEAKPAPKPKASAEPAPKPKPKPKPKPEAKSEDPFPPGWENQ
ncbi:MAG: hypothetical protein AAB152_15755 [Candidatus Coatesbacteria bacterium]